MKMKRLFFAAATIVMLTPLVTTAQSSPARDKFFTFFNESYQEIAKPPLVNYFVNLNNAIELSFSTENKYFIPALTETAARYKISEAAAADSLYYYSLNKLLAEKLWIGYDDIYKDYQAAFKAYNDAFCPCITKNFKATDYIEKMMPVLQKCIAEFVTDTAAQSNIRRYAGDKTLNDIFRRQQYFSLYIYQNCEVVKASMNQVLRQEAYSGYAAARSSEKNNRAKNAVNYYRDKKLDSLAIIFPNYKKFTKELNEAVVLAKANGTRYTAYFLSNGEEKNSIVNFFNEEAQLGDMTATFSSDVINATITKVAFRKQEPRSDTSEIIIRPIEDKAVPVKQ